MKRLIKEYPLAVLLLVAAVMLFAHLGLIQTNIMEARNLISAREMVKDGHWIFTTLNNMPRYEKPPLPTWITAMFMLMGGMEHMFILRLPAALICLLLVYFFYKLTKTMQLKNNQPLVASLILITSFYIFFAGRDNQWDIYTHAFTVVSLYFLVKAFEKAEHAARNILLSGLFFGFSFLSKGPVSFYGLMLSFLIAYFIVYRNSMGRNLLCVLFVLIIGLLIGFSWPLYVKYFDVHAGTAISKQAENWSNYEVKPFWYYWSFFTQSGIWTVPAFIGLMYLYMRRRVQDVKAYTFSFLWTIISVILLSLIPEKKARYLLPVLIPLAMNTSFYIQYLIESFKNIKAGFEKGIVYFSFGLIALVAFAAPVALYFLFKERVGAYIIWFSLFAIVSICCGIILTGSLLRQDFHRTFYTTIFFMCGVVITVIPLSKMYYTNTNYYAASNLGAVEKKLNIKTYEGDEFVPEITWDYGNYMPNLSQGKNISMPADSVFGLLMDSTSLNNYQKAFPNYTFNKYAEVDLNAPSKNEKSYNSRLVKEYYVVRKGN